jgi:hypothetical protein
MHQALSERESYRVSECERESERGREREKARERERESERERDIASGNGERKEGRYIEREVNQVSEIERAS